MKDGKSKVCKIFQEASRFVVTSHQNIDGDGLGSALALFFLLQKMGKEAKVVYDGRVPYFYLFLPGAESILSFEAFVSLGEPFDALVVVDCSNPGRLGRVEELFPKASFVVNVDHHPDNAMFGHANFVVPSSPASALLVYELVQKVRVPLDSDIATNILTGIVTDTGGFQFAELNRGMFTVVGELVASGASLSTIMRYVFRYRRVEALKLLSRALEHLVFDSSCGCATTYLTQRDFEECGAREEDAEGIVDYGLYIPEAEVSIFFKEIAPGVYKVSLRSRGDFDVLSVAHHFGGGGHRKAAGFKMSGS
ncbi:MAG: bifunctional oligoribonuclease/PAP phosphatase NrnA, partial [Candidatus Caldatribacterium sp.]|nr:bifunctional oligoribonuclease/PAP phosphatase NrnA [Candidatus Caldatribacterium sp.]